MLWQCINYVSDIAVGLLLKLISLFLLIIAFSSERCREFYNIFPKNLYSLTKFVKSEISFDQYVVCLKCYSLYNYDNCYVCIEGINVLRTCTFVEFPNHRLPHFEGLVEKLYYMKFIAYHQTKCCILSKPFATSL
jgi:hypothetical protein